MERPITIEVKTNIQGMPLNIKLNGEIERITKIYQQWIVSDRIISEDTVNKYFMVRTNQSRVYDIYHESISNVWYIDRVHQ